MSEPTHDMMRRAVSALGPFVSAYRLSLNPEDLAEIAYAVLKHANSDATMREIQEAVAEKFAGQAVQQERLRASYRANRPDDASKRSAE